MKRYLAVLCCAASSLVGAQAELTPQERDSLLQRLEALREAADSRFDSRFRTAVQAFRSAMASDESAVALYLNCVEKLEFTDKNRRASDFREWRNRHDERLKSSAFRRALRYQLNWLVLSLQASMDDVDRSQLAASAQQIIDQIVGDADNLAGHQNVLEQSALGSVFARTYEINGISVDSWVDAPARIGQVYEQIIMPQYREAARAGRLRELWTKRIQQQIRLAEAWRFGMKSNRIQAQAIGAGNPDHEKFMSHEVPRMQWQMETDVFKHGDPAGAARRMLTHLERNMAHSSVLEWAEELHGLLSTVPAGKDESDDDVAARFGLPSGPPTPPVTPRPGVVLDPAEDESLYNE